METPTPTPSNTPSRNDDSLKPGIDHASTGYKNAQEVIRFMDTKSGVIAGFALAGIGCVFQGGKEIIFSDKVSVKELVVACPFGTWLVSCIAMVSVIFGFWSVYCAIRCINPRSPNIKFPLPLTILFPYFAPNRTDVAKSRYARLKSNTLEADGKITSVDIAEEYESQLLNIGAILEQKIEWNKKAAESFLRQLALLTLTGFLTFFYFLLKNVPTNFCHSG